MKTMGETIDELIEENRRLRERVKALEETALKIGRNFHCTSSCQDIARNAMREGKK